MKKIIRTLVSKKRAKIFCGNMVYNIEPRRGIRTFSKCRFPSCLAPREPEPSRAGEMWIHAYQEQIYLYRHHFQMWLCVCLWSNSFFSFLPPSLFSVHFLPFLSPVCESGDHKLLSFLVPPVAIVSDRPVTRSPDGCNAHFLWLKMAIYIYCGRF
jgi:hypothetical protein